MKTILDIPLTKLFYLFQDGFKSTFVKVDCAKHDGMNGRCVDSENPTYYKGEYYFIQLDIEVKPV